MLIFCVYFDLGVRVLVHCVCCGCRLGVYCIHASVIVQVCKLMAGLMVGMLPLCPRGGGGHLALGHHWPAATPIFCILLLGLLCCRRQAHLPVYGYAAGQLKGIDPVPAQRGKRWADIDPAPI